MPLSRTERQTAPVAEAQAAAHVDAILRSHERSLSFGLARIDLPDFARIAPSELAQVRERNQRLCLHAAPVMELLSEQMVAAQSMVVLTDAQGTILHSVGHDGFLERASKVALAPGANWAEASKGTNAIGTALVTEAPTLVHGSEHYLQANHFLTCSATPIFDPRGDMLGVLNVSGEQSTYHSHTMGLVKMSARMIENHLLSDVHHNALLLQFHPRPEFIGTLMEGMLAVDQDGRILGANRRAHEILGLGSAALRRATVQSVLGTTVGALVSYFRSRNAAPMKLVVNRAMVSLRARFNWHGWYSLGQVPQATLTSASASAGMGAALYNIDAAPETDLAAPDNAAEVASAHTLEEIELNSIRAVLSAENGNVSKAAKKLGISRNTIYRKLRTPDSRLS